MIDIISAEMGQDMGVLDTQTSKAANVLGIQLGALEYQKDFGVDIKYFLTEAYQFQNESFKSYLIQTLANWGVNVASATETLESLYEVLAINVTNEQTTTALIAR